MNLNGEGQRRGCVWRVLCSSQKVSFCKAPLLTSFPGMNAGDSYRAHAAGAVRVASMGSCFMEGSYSTIVLITKDLGQ